MTRQVVVFVGIAAALAWSPAYAQSDTQRAQRELDRTRAQQSQQTRISDQKRIDQQTRQQHSNKMQQIYTPPPKPYTPPPKPYTPPPTYRR